MRISSCFILAVVISLFGCKSEPIYEISPPVKLTDWSKSDTSSFPDLVILNNGTVKCRATSNYFTTGNDTIKTVNLEFGNNTSGITELSYKYNTSDLAGSKLDLSSVLDFEVYHYQKGRLLKDSFKLVKFSFNRSTVGTKFDQVGQLNIDFNFVVKGKSNVFSLITTGDLTVSNSCFLVYESGKTKPLEIEKSVWDVDVKGGSKYFPSPTLLYKNDFRSPNDFILFRMDFNRIDVIDTKMVLLDPKTVQYKRKGKFYNCESGVNLDLKEYIFEKSFSGTIRNIKFVDSANQSIFIFIDSIYFQSHLMPF
jgi:hypothetical protein